MPLPAQGSLLTALTSTFVFRSHAHCLILFADGPQVFAESGAYCPRIIAVPVSLLFRHLAECMRDISSMPLLADVLFVAQRYAKKHNVKVDSES